MESEINLEQILSEIHLKGLCQFSAASSMVKEKKYQILTLKMIKIGHDGLEDESYSYVLFQGQIYQVGEDLLQANLLEGGHRQLLDLVEDNFTYTAQVANGLMDEVEGLEDSLYEKRNLRYFMDIWFHLKKDFSKIERLLARAAIVLREFVRLQDDSSVWPKSEFLDLIDKMEVYTRSAQTQLSKLDTMHHYLNSMKTDKMNTNLYLLGLVSGIFLPLNLIVGFFGMNTPNLFLHDNPQATYYVSLGLGVVFIILLFGLPATRIFNQLILSKLFGRFDFYQKIENKIEDLELEVIPHKNSQK